MGGVIGFAYELKSVTGNDVAAFFSGLTCIVVIVVFLKLVVAIFDYSSTAVIGAKVFSHIDPFPKKMFRSDVRTLEMNFPYYNKLPKRSKRIFESRLVKFSKSKKFVSKDGLLITREMKVLFSACAIQLTFGLRDFRFKHFPVIEIHPQKFMSNAGKRYHLGETDARGVLRFSWLDFKKGYDIEDDNRNLGLHEFSHALFLNYLSGKKDDSHFDDHYREWKRQGAKQFFRLKATGSSYIRSYAQTNLMEFFAVCVECFFETPIEFKVEHPHIYQSIQMLLAQNPRLLEK